MNPAVPRRLPAPFHAMSGLFEASRGLSLATFSIYVDLLLRDPSKTTTVFITVFFATCLLEASLGAVGDLVSGRKAFELACALTAASALMYALAYPFREEISNDTDCLLWYLIIAEFIGVIGFSMHSGSFESWYRRISKDLTPEKSSHDVFRGFNLLRTGYRLAGGAAGLALLPILPPQWRNSSTSSGWLDILLIPEFIAFTLRFTALLVPRFWRAAAPLESAPPHRAALTSIGALCRETIKVLQHGFDVVVRTPEVLAVCVLEAGNMLVRTVLAWFTPLLVWRLSDLRVPLSDGMSKIHATWLVLFWVTHHLLKLGGARLSRNRATHDAATASGRQAGHLVEWQVMLFSGMVSLAGLLVAMYPTSATAFVISGILLSGSMFFHGLMEPSLDATISDRTPPTLFATIQSFRIMFGALACACAVAVIHFLALWSSESGLYEPGYFSKAVGALTLASSLVALSLFRRSDRSPNERGAWPVVGRMKVVPLVLAASVLGLVVMVLDTRGMQAVESYRSIVGASDKATTAPGFLLRNPQLGAFAETVATALALLLFVVCPTAAFVLFAGRSLRARSASAIPQSVTPATEFDEELRSLENKLMALANGERLTSASATAIDEIQARVVSLARARGTPQHAPNRGAPSVAMDAWRVVDCALLSLGAVRGEDEGIYTWRADGRRHTNVCVTPRPEQRREETSDALAPDVATGSIWPFIIVRECLARLLKAEHPHVERTGTLQRSDEMSLVVSIEIADRVAWIQMECEPCWSSGREVPSLEQALAGLVSFESACRALVLNSPIYGAAVHLRVPRTNVG